jgi:hypothetical protein
MSSTLPPGGGCNKNHDDECLRGGVVRKTVMECNKKTFWWFQALMGACKRCKSALLGPQEKVCHGKKLFTT